MTSSEDVSVTDCFKTPAPSLQRPLHGAEDNRAAGALEPPPLEQRKKDTTTPEPFLFCPIIETDFPFLEWPNLCNNLNAEDGGCDPMPAFTLRPRTKLHPRSFFLPISPQDHERNYERGEGEGREMGEGRPEIGRTISEEQEQEEEEEVGRRNDCPEEIGKSPQVR